MPAVPVSASFPPAAPMELSDPPMIIVPRRWVTHLQGLESIMRRTNNRHYTESLPPDHLWDLLMTTFAIDLEHQGLEACQELLGFVKVNFWNAAFQFERNHRRACKNEKTGRTDLWWDGMPRHTRGPRKMKGCNS